MSDTEAVLAPNRYYDRHFDCEAVKILPGEYYATTRDMLIVTVLGSCVSVCLRDRDSGVAGMNHFMLPSTLDSSDPIGASARYGVFAMELLINHLIKLGGRRHRFEAKVFGGGNVLRGLTATNVGSRNAEFAEDYLRTERIPIVAHDVMGEFPRKVYFFSQEGRVLVKKLRQMHNHTILDREAEYGSRLKQTRVAGDVDLFT